MGKAGRRNLARAGAEVRVGPVNLWVKNGREKLCLCGEWVRSWSVALPPLSAAGGGFGAFFLITLGFWDSGLDS